MSTTFTLDNMRSELEREYAPLTLEVGDQTLVLRSLLRCDKTVREAVSDRLKELNDSGDDATEEETLAAVAFILESVTADGKGKILVDAIGDDILLASHLISKWREATQPGEASDSPV